MRPIYLLDTCIISEPVKPLPAARVIRCLEKYGDVSALAAPVLHEVLYGVNRLSEGKQKWMLKKYVHDIVLRQFPIVFYDEHAVWIHSDFRSKLECAGRTISFIDGMIASIAIANNMVLVTRNTADFEGIQTLMLENWFEN